MACKPTYKGVRYNSIQEIRAKQFENLREDIIESLSIDNVIEAKEREVATELEKMPIDDVNNGVGTTQDLEANTDEVYNKATQYTEFEDFVESMSDFRDSHSAPSKDERNTEEKLEEGGDFSLQEVASGFHNQPNDYFDTKVGARYYGYDNLEGRESLTAINNIQRALKAGRSDLKVTAYRAIPNNIDVREMKDYDWVSLSKTYAVNHGEHRFGEGEYRIIEQEIPITDLWWDGNDINEWGYDTGNTKHYSRRELQSIWNEAQKVKTETSTSNLETNSLQKAIQRNNGNPLNLAPNGKPSIFYQSYKDLGYTDTEAENLTSKVYSDEFQAWFGDWVNNPQEASKVVDINGQPLVVFHGTEMNFKEFSNQYNPRMKGFYFSNDKANSKTYGEKVMSVFLDIKSPLVVESRGFKFTDDIPIDVVAKYPNEEAYDTKISIDIDEIVRLVKNGKDTNSFIEVRDNEKYDGVIFKDIIDASLTSRRNVAQDTITAFNPNQIKSATENTGQFSNESNDIRFQSGAVKTENKENISQIINKLKETGLAEKVFELTSAEMEAKLVELGLDADIAKQVSVWHGSPHNFDRFTTEKMGTGEGAQAFGWGLYFTDLESIARNYATTLRRDGDTYRSLSKDEAIQLVKSKKDGFSFIDGDVSNGKDGIDYIEERYKNNDPLFTEKGVASLYKVSLHKGKTPSEYTWLEWDKPINSTQKEMLFKNVSESSLSGEIHNIEISDRFDADSFDGGKTYRVGDTSKMGQEDEFTNVAYNTLEEALIEATRLNFLDTNVRGRDFYESLAKEKGQKEASIFLFENGIDGIKYPAESISRGATSDNARGFNYVVFDENAVTIEEQIQFQKALSKVGIDTIPNGFTYKNEVYLNTDLMTEDLPIHEFNHLYTKWLKENNKATYDKGISLITEELSKEDSEIKDVIDFVKTNQPNLKGEKLKEEILTELVGRRGVEIIEENKDSAITNWLKNVWDKIKGMLGLSQFSASQVSKMNLGEYSRAMAVDLLRGEELRPSPILSTEQELEQIKAQAIANGTFMKAPNGNSTNLNERQWLQVRSKAFKDWFGDWQNDPQNASKVVDENGEPLVVYHGTSYQGEDFISNLTGEEVLKKAEKPFYQFKETRSGFYFFADNIVAAEGWASSRSTYSRFTQRIIPAFLNIRTLNSKNFNGGFITDEYIDSFQKVKEDNITMFNVIDDMYGEAKNLSNVFAVKNPNQIKSATDNVGTFSAQSSDIRYQVTEAQITQEDKSNSVVALSIGSNTLESISQQTINAKVNTYQSANDIGLEIVNLYPQSKSEDIQREFNECAI